MQGSISILLYTLKRGYYINNGTLFIALYCMVKYVRYTPDA